MTHFEKLLILLAICASLASCGTLQQNNPILVEVPIATPCQVEMPSKPISCVAKNESRAEWLRCTLADMQANKGYAAQIESMLKACLMK